MTITPLEIVLELYAHELGITAARVAKARGLARRCGVDWSAVLAAMTDEQRNAVQDAEVPRR